MMKYLLNFLFTASLFASAPELTNTLSPIEVAKLTASDATTDERFGYSVAISGDTLVVGAEPIRFGGNNLGSVYVYTRNHESGIYTQRAKLTASDTASDDKFGSSVAIDGDVIVVGAYGDDDGGSDSGSVYVFEKPELGWSDMQPSAKLTASDAAAGDYFGHSVAIKGDVVVVGAPYDDERGSNTGSVYVFEKFASRWYSVTQSAKLSASDAAMNDRLGWSVANNIGTVVAGAPYDDDGGADSGSVYIFEKSTLNWNNMTQSAKFNASDAAAGDYFGRCVAIDGDIIVVGAPYNDDTGMDAGAAYIFEKSAASRWANTTQDAKLTMLNVKTEKHLGRSVAISGDTVVVGAGTYGYDGDGTDAGNAYVYKKSASHWSDKTQSAQLTASNTAMYDFFGSSVAISGDVIVAGAHGDDDNGADAGAVYAFENALSVNTFENKRDIIDLEALDAEGDNIYFSLLSSGDAAHFSVDSGVLRFNSAPDYEHPVDANGDNQYDVMLNVYDNIGESHLYHGIVHVSDVDYEKPMPKALSYKELGHIEANPPIRNERFGWSVAIQGNTAVVGAPESYPIGGTGAAYLYEYNSTSKFFDQRAVLRASDASSDDRFGVSVAIDGDVVVVGADKQNYAGSVYIFEKPASGWVDMTQSAKLTSSDRAATDYFGSKVAISGDTVVVGAYYDDDGGDASGSAYIFEKQGVHWSDMNQSAKLTATDAATYDAFGISVAISGNVVAVGASASNFGSGKAYIFEKPASGWANMTQSAKLTASDAALQDRFGYSIAISGNVVVGANGDDDGASDSGSVYLFEKPASGWADMNQSAKLTASDAAEDDSFGGSVAIDGDTVVVGAAFDDDINTNSGSIYLFEKPASGWADMTQNAKHAPQDSPFIAYFGLSVCISGDTVIGGMHNGNNFAGSAYLFKAKERAVSTPLLMYLLF